MSRIYDISRPLDSSAWVWQGDIPFSSELGWKIADGASVNVGRITMSCHCGTHMDAPFHFNPEGGTSELLDLASGIGPCEVLPIERLGDARAERVLVKSGGRAPTVAELGSLGGALRLFGTDWHSVDPMDSKTLDAHHWLWRKGATILEELDLSAVPDGRYELVALPLKVVGLDAAPVRAVLLG